MGNSSSQPLKPSHSSVNSMIEKTNQSKLDLYITANSILDLKPHVEEVTLHFKDDVYQCPDEIFDFTSLVKLNLTHYPFQTLSSSIGKLKNLKSLILYGSSLNCVPREIGQLSKLEEFDPYTSYGLHYLPYEILHCPITNFRISIRALYENYKFKTPAPILAPWPTEQDTFPTLKDLCANHVINLKLNVNKLPKDLQQFIKTAKTCAVCKKMYFGDVTDDYDLNAVPSKSYRIWKANRVGNDRVLLLVIACSANCANNAKGKRIEEIDRSRDYH